MTVIEVITFYPIVGVWMEIRNHDTWVEENHHQLIFGIIHTEVMNDVWLTKQLCSLVIPECGINSCTWLDSFI
jgi:hypothetical protein